MDFALTEEQEFFKKMITDTVDRLIVPKAREIDEKEEFPWELWREFTRLGYLGLRYPEEIGGMNADPVTAMIFYEQMARGSVGFAQSVIMNALMGTYFIYRFGTEEIKQRCLYPAIRGEKIATMCFTEDQSGSDLAATRTRAEKDGAEWVINFFLVEKGTPGFSPGQVLDKLGCRGTVTGELVFDHVRIPEENLLGAEVNKGVEYLSEVLDEVRAMTGAMALGIAQAAYDEGLDYARKRVTFGKTIGNYQLIRAKFADMATEMEASRLMVYYAAWRIKEKLSCRKEAAMAKMFATETCLKVVDEVTRIWGANAFAHEYNPQRHFRDARFLLYGGGTHEIIKDFLGRMIIGKY
jgi:butyryl-CoA dehydrogenase